MEGMLRAKGRDIGRGPILFAKGPPSRNSPERIFIAGGNLSPFCALSVTCRE